MKRHSAHAWQPRFSNYAFIFRWNLFGRIFCVAAQACKQPCEQPTVLRVPGIAYSLLFYSGGGSRKEPIPENSPAHSLFLKLRVDYFDPCPYQRGLLKARPVCECNSLRLTTRVVHVPILLAVLWCQGSKRD